jgi:hypothetical protein
MRLSITRTETYTVDVDASDIREACDKYGIPHEAFTIEHLLGMVPWNILNRSRDYSWEQWLAYLASGQDADSEAWELEAWATE